MGNGHDDLRLDGGLLPVYPVLVNRNYRLNAFFPHRLEFLSNFQPLDFQGLADSIFSPRIALRALHRSEQLQDVGSEVGKISLKALLGEDFGGEVEGEREQSVVLVSLEGRESEMLAVVWVPDAETEPRGRNAALLRDPLERGEVWFARARFIVCDG